FQAEDGIRDSSVTGVQTCALPISPELMQYESFPSASEVATQLAGGRFSVGIDGYRELERFIRAGKLRGLAVVSRQPIEGVNIPKIGRASCRDRGYVRRWVG